MRSRPPRSSPRLWRWLLLWLVWLPVYAVAAPAIDVTADFQWADLAEHVDILPDPAGRFEASAVAQPPLSHQFTPARSDALQNTDHTSTYWLRFAVANSDAADNTLLLTWRLQHGGAIVAYEVAESVRALPRTTPSALQMQLPAGTKTLYLLRISPGGLVLAQLELHGMAHYIDSFRDRTWLNGLSQGGLLALALTALFLFWLYRETPYLWLAAHTIAFQGLLLYLHSDLRLSLLPQPAIANSFLQPVPLGLLLIAGLCSLRFAQTLPIAATEQRYAQRSLQLNIAVILLMLPLALAQPTLATAAVIVMLSGLSLALTVGIALYGFLASYQRHLLLYALIRTIMLLMLLGGGLAWNAGSNLKSLVIDLLPLAGLIEGLGLLGLLLWRSRQQDRHAARADRDIAILEAEGRSRTEVIAEVGHRVRTPISGVLGMLDMLQDTPLSATQLDYLNTIRRAGNELLNVVEEMSDLTQLQNQSAPLQQTLFDPQGLVAECVDGFRSLAAAHRLELINDPAPALPAFVSGDPTRLRQLMLQLLHREIGRHESGEIVIRIEPLAAPNWLRFHIETLARRAQSTPSRIDRRLHAPGSANVRTAIARQLIERLGGRFTERELDDTHTELWFDLALPMAARNESALEQNSELHQKHLLIIDDSPTFCDVLRRQASHWGMTVHSATSASEGLARLRNQVALDHPIDVLLIDADMPELEASDWLQRLRDIDPLPLVLLLSSQSTTPAIARHGIDVRRVLLKPVNNNSLKITLIEELKRRAQPALARSALDTRPIRCLYAEDNEINAKVLAGMLAKLGVSAVGVDNGQQAVEAVQRDKFDIVLMDCDMPVMDGWEASKRIREIFQNRGVPTIPIIALTANTVEELGERARQPLMDAHLVKPIHLQDLRALLENWTGKIIATAKTAAE